MTPEQATALFVHTLRDLGLQSERGLQQLEELLHKGAEIEGPMHNGMTPLQYVLWRTGQQDITQPYKTFALFLRHGAALSGKDWSAEILSKDETTHRLFAREDLRRRDPYLSKHVSLLNSHLPMPGAEITDDVISSFLFACQGGYLDDVKYMVHFYPDCIGWTTDSSNCLGKCLSGGRDTHHVAAFLIEKGADVNWANCAGMTPLMVAARLTYGDAFITMFIDAGGDETLENEEGENALDIARANRHSAVLQALENSIAARDARRRDAGRDAITARIMRKPGKFKL